MITRRLLNSVAIGLGFIGTGIALALVVGVWLSAGRVIKGIDRLSTSADHGVVRTSDLLDRIGGRIGTVGDRVRAVPNQLTDLARRHAGTEAGLATGLSRVTTLETASRELETWAARAEQASERLSDASAGLTDLQFFSGVVPESLNRLAGHLDTLASALGAAVKELDALHAAVDAATRSAEIPETARRAVLELSTATSDRLKAVEDRVGTARGRFDEIQSGIGKLRQRASTWVWGIAALLTVLLAWLGIGQASLFYLGWNSWAIGGGNRGRGGFEADPD